MRARLVTVTILCVASLGACKSKGAEPSAEVAAAEETAPSTAATQSTPARDLFAAAGTEGALAIAIWPEHWSSMQASARSLASREALAPLDVVASWESAWAALAVVAGKTTDLRVAIEQPAALDGSRPIVLSISAPMARYEDLARTVGEAIEARRPVPQPGLRHRVILPATDASALAAELRAMLSTSHEAVSGRTDEFVENSTWVRIEPGPSWVAVDIVTGRGEGQEPPSLAALRVEPSAADEVFARSGESAVRLLIRLHTLDEVGPYWGMNQVARAAREIAPEHLLPLLAQGTSEVLTSTVAIDSSAATARSVLAEVGTGGGAPSLAVRVTEAGAKAFATDAGLASGKEIAAGDVAWLVVAQKAPAAPALSSSTPNHVVSDMFHRCGYACMLDAFGGNGLALLSLLAPTPAAVDELVSEAEKAIGLDLGVELEGGLLLVGARGEPSAFHGLAVAPSADETQSAAAACFSRYRMGLVTGLGTIGTIAPTDRKRLLAKLGAELADDRACAAKDAAIAPRIEALASLLAILRG